MEKRGMSYVIASVLIIAFAIVLGLTIYLWASSFTEGVHDKADETSRETLHCSRTKLNLKYGCISEDSITLMVENQGQVPIVGLNMRVIGTSEAYSEVTGDSLEAAQLVKKTLELSPALGTLKYVEVLPIVDIGRQVTCTDKAVLHEFDKC